MGRNPYSVAVADFNGDGYRDLAIGNSFNNTVTVLLNSAPGLTTNPPSLTFYASDGHPVANQGGGITALLGNGSGGFTPASSTFAAGSIPLTALHPPTNQTFGVMPFTITATASSGLPVTFHFHNSHGLYGLGFTGHHRRRGHVLHHRQPGRKRELQRGCPENR
ncbi:MAG TPA: FG-GAP repeat protein [Bryobacteraceae bacterium]|nr:FG-GAP repeat protein [Bryobacteraceae bacterium]